MFTCITCGLQYNSKSGFYKHMRTTHEKEKRYIFVINMKCKLVLRRVNLFALSKNTYQLHLNIRHMVDINNDTLNFEIFEGNNNNLRNGNMRLKKYINRTSTKKVNNTEYSYYYCHRSFYPRISSKCKRSLKNGGSVKIGKICPSYIKLHKKDNQLIVEYNSNHLWHQNEIGKLRLTTAGRAQLAGKLSMGILIQRVLNDVRDSEEEITLKHLHNIKRDYNIIKRFTKRHENNIMSVQLWAEQLAKGSNNPVLYFKHQGQDDVTKHLGKDDFCIIIMTDFQADMLVKFEMTKYVLMGPMLYTLLVVDEYGTGIPVAFCFSNKSDTATYIFFFMILSNLGSNRKSNSFIFYEIEIIINTYILIIFINYPKVLNN
ncbi:Uncharacterized protein FWK35_00025280 [Aphis craccivora]|uniref:C2H2-type domain-containing protein n=1 Tax=Aphis craccivora TaxID=307492 RepID=A0A6G0YLS7_APHCR|nr:Uncharacterized protein FWK35_00025280 [Aphis craccivora]